MTAPRGSRPRRTWTIRPVSKPHSTKKGKKGYSRQAEKQRVRKEALADR